MLGNNDLDRLTKMLRGEIPWGTDLSWMSQLSSFLNSYFASRGTGISSYSDQEKGNDITGLDAFNSAYNEYMMNLQNQFSMNAYREDRQWQEDMYNRYQSIPAQVRQMQEAGINPAVMLGGGTPSSGGVSGSSVPQSADAGHSPAEGRMRPLDSAATSFSSVMQSILGMLGLGTDAASGISGIVRNKYLNDVSQSQADNYDADTQLKYQQADGQMLDNMSKSIDLEFKRYNAQLDQMYKEETINKIRAEISNIEVDTLLKTKTIEVNGKQIDLMSQQIAESEQRQYLLQMQGMLTKIKKDQQKRLGELQQELISAQVMMTQAQSVVVKEQQTKAYAEAQIATLEYIKQQKLMDGGYVEELLKEMKHGRNRRNAEAIIGNICNVLNSIAGFVPFAGGSSYSPTAGGSTSVTW